MMNESDNGKTGGAARLRDEARSMTDEVRKRAGEAAQAAQSEAIHRAEGAKASVADEIADAASALRTARDEMSERSIAGRGFGWAAQSLETAANAMRERDPGELVNELGAFARRNPAMFLGSAALLGFAVSRFALASARRDTAATPDAQMDAASSARTYGQGGSAGSEPFAATRPITPSSPAAAVTPGGSFQS